MRDWRVVGWNQRLSSRHFLATTPPPPFGGPPPLTQGRQRTVLTFTNCSAEIHHRDAQWGKQPSPLISSSRTAYRSERHSEGISFLSHSVAPPLSQKVQLRSHFLRGRASPKVIELQKVKIGRGGSSEQTAYRLPRRKRYGARIPLFLLFRKKCSFAATFCEVGLPESC